MLTVSLVVLAATNSLRIRDVEARLYYHDTGTLSEPVTPQTALWNTIIGEGDAQEPSTSTLVDVIVEGEAGTFEVGSRVQLIVKNSSTDEVIAELGKDVGVLSDAGLSHIAFWLPNTGCEPLRIIASTGATSMEIHVPFECGE